MAMTKYGKGKIIKKSLKEIKDLLTGKKNKEDKEETTGGKDNAKRKEQPTENN